MYLFLIASPCAEVGVKQCNRKTEDIVVSADKNEIQAKAEKWGKIISCVYPQWIVT